VTFGYDVRSGRFPFRFFDLPGFASHEVEAQVRMVDGEPRVVGLVITPKAESGDPALSGARLRSLPLRDMARAAMPASQDELVAALGAVANAPAPKHDPRASVSLERFTEAWRAAYDAPLATRDAVCQALAISERTYDRYRRRAVDRGLIPDTRKERK
jgi:hypothetical protein